MLWHLLVLGVYGSESTSWHGQVSNLLLHDIKVKGKGVVLYKMASQWHYNTYQNDNAQLGE